jgi:hypothetical protein
MCSTTCSCTRGSSTASSSVLLQHVSAPNAGTRACSRTLDSSAVPFSLLLRKVVLYMLASGACPGGMYGLHWLVTLWGAPFTPFPLDLRLV